MLAGQGFPSRDIHHLDDLVSLWLSADDYRRLRRLAPNRMPTGDVDDLLENWLSDADVRRLGHLVIGMRFAQPRYAVCSTKRAAQAVLERVGGEPGFSDAEIATMLDSAAADADEDAALAATGLDDDIISFRRFPSPSCSAGRRRLAGLWPVRLGRLVVRPGRRILVLRIC